MYCLCTRCIIVNSVQVHSEFGEFAYTAICMRKCTLWSDNTCVFTRFHSVKNANTQLIRSSVMWPKVHFRVMSSTSKITKRDKEMYLMWTVQITHLRHAFVQCCASFPLLGWEYLYAMAAAIINVDSAVTWHRYQTKKFEGSRVPD